MEKMAADKEAETGGWLVIVYALRKQRVDRSGAGLESLKSAPVTHRKLIGQLQHLGTKCSNMSLWGPFHFIFKQGCPGTFYVDQTGLRLRDLPPSASQGLELKVCN